MDKINSKVLLKVAECGSFVKAARELGYTQAGISYIVSTTEAELGFALFIRERSRVKLTAEGEELLPYIRRVETDNRLLEQKAEDLRGLKCGKIRVIVFDSVSVHWIPGILREFKRDYPGVEVELVTIEDSRRAEEMIYHQEADCAFFLHSPVSAQIDSFPLMEEKLLAVIPPEHPLALSGESRFPVSRLGDYPYIRMAFGDVTGIEAIFSSRHIVPQAAYHLDNDYAALAMVSAGLGFCIFPELLLQNIPYKVKCLEFDEPVSRIVSIGTRSFGNCSAATREFIRYTREWTEKYRVKALTNTASEIITK